jgi:hypothetical protein
VILGRNRQMQREGRFSCSALLTKDRNCISTTRLLTCHIASNSALCIALLLAAYIR